LVIYLLPKPVFNFRQHKLEAAAAAAGELALDNNRENVKGRG
jgi:hypothetical protein